MILFCVIYVIFALIRGINNTNAINYINNKNTKTIRIGFLVALIIIALLTLMRGLWYLIPLAVMEGIMIFNTISEENNVRKDNMRKVLIGIMGAISLVYLLIGFTYAATAGFFITIIDIGTYIVERDRLTAKGINPIDFTNYESDNKDLL